MSPKVRMILLWVGRALIAAVFVATGSSKLTGSPMMIESFAKYGLGDWFRYFTGAVEIIGAVLLLVPKTSFYGACLLMCVLVGAFIAQVAVLHGDVIHVFVLAAIVAALAWFQRPGTSGTTATVAG